MSQINKNQSQHSTLYRNSNPGTSLPKVKVVPEPKPQK